MPAPSTEKKVRGGRLQYKSRFIAKLTSVCEPPLLRKDQPVVWNEQCQIAFDNMKEYLMNLPVLQQPRPGKPLIFYFAIEETSVGAMVPKKAGECFDGASNKAGAGIGVIIVRISQDVRDQRNRYSEIRCWTLVMKKQEPVMVATVEEKPWFYDVQKYLQDREYPDHPLTRQSSES
ncbi:UNVERIFIED_CONTAM: hypothetical protein Scaly_2998700 [Sesamum calycinum]|uniref:Reverse transcriptase/retrotransposon-derived protein RNase H-like domain-containing protein n=1 Tax=Sesamum calycinum TaxID=2727403 RepID=A0AAW2KF82_9LAMI